MSDPTRSVIDTWADGEAASVWSCNCNDIACCGCRKRVVAERDALIRERDELKGENSRLRFSISGRDGDVSFWHGKHVDALRAVADREYRLKDAESLCNALMTVGLEECEKLRNEVDAFRRRERYGAVARALRTQIDGLFSRVEETAKERDTLRSQLDAMTKERDEARERVKALEGAVADVIEHDDFPGDNENPVLTRVWNELRRVARKGGE